MSSSLFVRISETSSLPLTPLRASIRSSIVLTVSSSSDSRCSARLFSVE